MLLAFKVTKASKEERENEEKVGISKGQLISKKFDKPRILPKNKGMNSFLLVCDVFSFVFWENPRLDWFAFEIN